MTKLWLSILAVTVVSWLMKASGPLVVGQRQLPPAAVKITSVLAAVLLAGLITVELGGPGWSESNWQQLCGVATAGLARILKAPMLLAVIGGIAATALLRMALS